MQASARHWSRTGWRAVPPDAAGVVLHGSPGRVVDRAGPVAVLDRETRRADRVERQHLVVAVTAETLEIRDALVLEQIPRAADGIHLVDLHHDVLDPDRNVGEPRGQIVL